MLGMRLALCWTLAYLRKVAMTSNIIIMTRATTLGAPSQLHVDSSMLTSAGGERADLKGVIWLTVECKDLVQMLASIIFLLNFFSLTSFPHKVCSRFTTRRLHVYIFIFSDLMIRLSVLCRQPWPCAAVPH